MHPGVHDRPHWLTLNTRGSVLHEGGKNISIKKLKETSPVGEAEREPTRQWSKKYLDTYINSSAVLKYCLEVLELYLTISI